MAFYEQGLSYSKCCPLRSTHSGLGQQLAVWFHRTPDTLAIFTHPTTRIHVALSTPQTLGQHPPHIPVYIWLFLRHWLWVSSCQCAITIPTYPYTCCSFNSTDSGSLDAITHPTYPYKCCSFYSTDSGSAAVSVSSPTPHTRINVALSTPETLGQQMPSPTTRHTRINMALPTPQTLGQQMPSPTPHTRINVVLSAPGQQMPPPTPCTRTNVARSTPQTLGQQMPPPTPRTRITVALSSPQTLGQQICHHPPYITPPA